MDFAILPSPRNRKSADVLVLPFWQNKQLAEAAFKDAALDSLVEDPLKVGDFKGKIGETLFIYVKGKSEKRIVLLGLGEKKKNTVESLRRAFSSLVKQFRRLKLQEINVVAPVTSLTEEEVSRGISEGLLLTNYVFNKLKGEVTKSEVPVLLTKATFIGIGKKGLDVAETCAEIAEGVYFARDLVNDNSDTVTPEYLAKVAQGLAKTLPHVKTTVFDKNRIIKEKMGLIDAVGRASPHHPAFIMVEYKGNPKSKEHVVLVGKGVTYDTGGLDLKNVGGFGMMDSMKCDMGGAATVLGALHAAAKLGLKHNITAVVGAVENAISGTSFKPGDVYTSYNGKTVEITSTDAEGRLVLADALSYVCKNLKPTLIIDFATLTGGIDVALGSAITGLMSNNDALAESLVSAGESTYERLWRLPLIEEYRDQLKSDVADLKNTAGRAASSIKAALFMQEFMDDTPWAHCDIASTAFLPDARDYLPKHATGIGVRLVIDFLQNR